MQSVKEEAPGRFLKSVLRAKSWDFAIAATASLSYGRCFHRLRSDGKDRMINFRGPHRCFNRVPLWPKASRPKAFCAAAFRITAVRLWICSSFGAYARHMCLREAQVGPAGVVARLCLI